MDSLTQIALGAAVGTAVLGRKVGPRAALWGAVCGTLPDLDVLLPYGDPVRDFTFHRAESHSLFWLTVASPALALLIHRLHRRAGASYREWLALVWLALVTHPLLDAMTVYGTQVLLPFSDYPVGVGSVFIIDPLYTVPLIAGIVGLAVAAQSRPGPRAALERGRPRAEHALSRLDGRGAVARRRRRESHARRLGSRRGTGARDAVAVQQRALARRGHGRRRVSRGLLLAVRRAADRAADAPCERSAAAGRRAGRVGRAAPRLVLEGLLRRAAGAARGACRERIREHAGPDARTGRDGCRRHACRRTASRRS